MGLLRNEGPATDLEREFANLIQQRTLCQDHVKSCHNQQYKNKPPDFLQKKRKRKKPPHYTKEDVGFMAPTHKKLVNIINHSRNAIKFMIRHCQNKIF